MLKFLSHLKDSALHLVYPPSCLHCRQPLPVAEALFCEPCNGLLTLIEPEERCPQCFGSGKNLAGKSCDECNSIRQVLHRIGAAFDYAGPAAALVRELKYCDRPYLARGAGAFMAAQFIRLGWPLPDALIPTPLSRMRRLDRGYNQSELIAKSMGEILQVPVWNILKRQSGDYSQAGLTLAQRKTMSGERFRYTGGDLLQDKTILIIDDVITSGSTMHHCGETLLAGCPAVIYGMAFCRAMR